jgi:hypothetical protein
MDKDKELELKVQMFCAAVRDDNRRGLFWMKRLTEDVNEAFELLKEHRNES